MIVTLEVVLAAAMCLLVAVLVLHWTGLWRRGPQFSWQGAGILLIMGNLLVSQFADSRRWPSSRVHALRSIGWPVILAGVVLVIVGMLVQGRARSRRGTTHR
jgi:hypothetical protein